MTTSPRLAITEISPTQNGKSTTHNAAVLALERAANDTFDNPTVGAGPWAIGPNDFTRNIAFTATAASVAFTITVPDLINGSITQRLFIVENNTTFTATVQSTGTPTGVVTVKAGASQVIRQVGTFLKAQGSPSALALTQLSDAPAVYTGKAYLPVAVNGAENGVEFRTVHDISGYFPGNPSSSQTIVRYESARTLKFPAGLTSSMAYLFVAPTSAFVIDLKKNGSSVGSINFAASSNTATFTLASLTTWSPGDRLELIAPATVDATALDLSFTLLGYRDAA